MNRRSPRQLADGADLVTFSGDKLLGRPAGRLHRRPQGSDRAASTSNPHEAGAAGSTRSGSRRWRRPCGSIAIPTGWRRRLPTIRLLARPQPEIEALAQRLLPIVGESSAAPSRSRSLPVPARSVPARCRSRRVPSAGSGDPAARGARRRPRARTRSPRRCAASRSGGRPHRGRRADPRSALPRGRGRLPRQSRRVSISRRQTDALA